MKVLNSVAKQGIGGCLREMNAVNDALRRISDTSHRRVIEAYVKVKAKTLSEMGQGTTEYAILVGVLVVIAIVAITLFKPKIEELWNAIAVGINGL